MLVEPEKSPAALKFPRSVLARARMVAGAVVITFGLVLTGVAVAASGTQTSATQMPGMPGMQGAGYWDDVAGEPFSGNGVVRRYYIAADQVAWDYAPLGRNAITGEPFDEVADTFVKTGPGRIGSKYLKCIYRAYSDPGFHHRVVRSEADSYLGLMGPVIRAEVGDTIRVSYRNNCSFPTSVHPHGVFYTKSSEGAPYNDGTSGADKADDAVPSGGSHTYIWQVPERAGPGPADGSSVMWMYHSHTDEVADTYAGLMGPMVVTRRGMARPDGSPKDVDKEFFELYSVMDENKSPLLEASAEKYEPAPYVPVDQADEEFGESNLMHSINGYVFGNQPVVSMKRGQHVRWYVMSMGTEVDLHTPHWHGNDVTVDGMRMDVVDLLPASMIIADMVPDNAGTYLYHCHVNDHITAGMLTRYTVK